MVHLDYRDARPIYAQITEQFKRQILAGVLQEGEKLPSVRELAGELAINPNTIQRAYQRLEIEGWIASVPGKGSFVCRVPADQTQDQQELLKTFDQTAARLLSRGVPLEELIQRLRKGGNPYA